MLPHGGHTGFIQLLFEPEEISPAKRAENKKKRKNHFILHQLSKSKYVKSNLSTYLVQPTQVLIYFRPVSYFLPLAAYWSVSSPSSLQLCSTRVGRHVFGGRARSRCPALRPWTTTAVLHVLGGTFLFNLHSDSQSVWEDAACNHLSLNISSEFPFIEVCIRVSEIYPLTLLFFLIGVEFQLTNLVLCPNFFYCCRSEQLLLKSGKD